MELANLQEKYDEIRQRYAIQMKVQFKMSFEPYNKNYENAIEKNNEINNLYQTLAQEHADKLHTTGNNLLKALYENNVEIFNQEIMKFSHFVLSQDKKIPNEVREIIGEFLYNNPRREALNILFDDLYQLDYFSESKLISYFVASGICQKKHILQWNVSEKHQKIDDYLFSQGEKLNLDEITEAIKNNSRSKTKYTLSVHDKKQIDDYMIYQNKYIFKLSLERNLNQKEIKTKGVKI